MVQRQYAGGSPASAHRPVAIARQSFGATKEVVKGNPDPRHNSTSFVERQYWTVRTNRRRYTPVEGFRRNLENHIAAVALNYLTCRYSFDHLARNGRLKSKYCGIREATVLS
jgi:hypothetical protein